MDETPTPSNLDARNDKPGAAARAGSLCVVNIPLHKFEQENLADKAWWKKFSRERDVWISDTSSRVLLVMYQDKWEELAEKYSEFTARCLTKEVAIKHEEITKQNPFELSAPYFRKREGWEAYRYLLEVVSGLRSHAPGDEHIAHQIFDESFTKYKYEKCGGNTPQFQSIVDALAYDMRQIRQKTHLENFPSLERTSVKLANIPRTKKADILIVGDTWKGVQNMLHALHKQSLLSPNIDIAHINPQAGSVESLTRQVDILKQKYPSIPPANTSSLDDILSMGKEWLGKYDAIFLTSALNAHPKKEDALIKMWSQCEHKPKLVMMNFLDMEGYEMGIMPHAELKVGKDALVVLPDFVKGEYDQEEVSYKKLVEKGRVACHRCAEIRAESQGKHHPIREGIDLEPEEYRAKYYLTREQRKKRSPENEGRQV